MKTLKNELNECLAEMKTAMKKIEKLTQTPGIAWPDLHHSVPLAVVINNNYDGLNHGFAIGDVVKVNDVDAYYHCSCNRITDGLHQYVHKNDLVEYIPRHEQPTQ